MNGTYNNAYINTNTGPIRLSNLEILSILFTSTGGDKRPLLTLLPRDRLRFLENDPGICLINEGEKIKQ